MGSEILIAVVGETGMGKTTFISRASGKTLAIGHDINSCTQDVGPVQFTLPATSVHAGKTVTLIDTPGFDDHDTRDVDILGRVAEYLSMTYGEGKRLTGVIYAQAIHTTRAGNSERTRNRLMKKLLGADAYHRVIIATTMWGRLSSESFGIVQSEQREANPDIWGDMIERGAEVVRHDDNQASALRIIDKIIDFGPPITLLIQSEMEQNGGRLSKTSAGRQLDADLGEQVAILRKQVEKLERDKEAQQAEKDELDAKIQALQNQRFKMRDWVIHKLGPMMIPAQIGIYKSALWAVKKFGPEGENPGC